MEFSDWRPKQEPEDGSNIYGTTSQFPSVIQPQSYMMQNYHSPERLQKERRLLILLEKLPTKTRNNNQYSQYPQTLQSDILDKPLDLSINSIQKDSKDNLNALEDIEYKCDICYQTFSLQDRLAKHVASRHRNRAPETPRIYECCECNRRFSRSDMLTRHMRTHTGIKPYVCDACGHDFSRSDHLVTHRRIHTGVKPYKCPACPYAACRRDMITRHMKIHVARNNEP